MNKARKNIVGSKSGNFYLARQKPPCKMRNPGYPLDSISVMPENKINIEFRTYRRTKSK